MTASLTARVESLRDRAEAALDTVSREQGLDATTRAVSGAVEQVLPTGPARDALHGVWLGHALHPMLTDLPIGAWTSAMMLDFVPGPGAARAAQALTGFGCLAALPTALSGAVDWSRAGPGDQRVGLVHAAANSVALAAYTMSWWARRRGRHWRGVLLGLAGATAATLGGYVGGHLVYRRGIGADRNADVDPPGEWTEARDLRPARVGTVATVAGEDVLVLDDPDEAVLARCGHLGGPLPEGSIVRDGARRCVQCPWHGSVFHSDDGSVVHGPATAPQPAYEVDASGPARRLRARRTHRR